MTKITPQEKVRIRKLRDEYYEAWAYHDQFGKNEAEYQQKKQEYDQIPPDHLLVALEPTRNERVAILKKRLKRLLIDYRIEQVQQGKPDPQDIYADIQQLMAEKRKWKPLEIPIYKAYPFDTFKLPPQDADASTTSLIYAVISDLGKKLRGRELKAYAIAAQNARPRALFKSDSDQLTDAIKEYLSHFLDESPSGEFLYVPPASPLERQVHLFLQPIRQMIPDFDDKKSKHKQKHDIAIPPLMEIEKRLNYWRTLPDDDLDDLKKQMVCSARALGPIKTNAILKIAYHGWVKRNESRIQR